MNDLLNSNELAQMLSISPTTLWRLRKQKPHQVRKFETPFAVGQRRYSRALVEQFLQGESITRLVRRRGQR